MKKLFLIPIIIAGFITGIFIPNIFPQASETKTITPISETTTVTTASTVSIPEPISLKIPTIDIETNIELVGNDAKGNMDVPKDAANVAWYEPGYTPGQNGNAVLAGHFDDPNGDPAVFYDLEKLQVGDTVEVTDKENKSYIFTVIGKESYPVDEFPISTVFGPSEKPHLNLITCEGSFNTEAETYSHRLVVFTELTEVVEI